MKTVLDEIIDFTKVRVAESKSKVSLGEIKKLSTEINCLTEFPFEKALSNKEMSFICECKKASPSKGVICKEFDYLNIARDYEKAGASAISVLTEPKWFMGNVLYLREISENVSIPCLRKDFVVDEYMIYEAKFFGAAAVLLICSVLDTQTIREYINICDTLGLSALVEVHSEEEVESAVNAGARIIGVNNRNLKDFTVDINNSLKIKKNVPNDIIFVAESGIKTNADIMKLRNAGVNAVLIGETLMCEKSKGDALKKLKGDVL